VGKVSRPGDYRLLVPDGWFRINLDGTGRYKAITTLVNRQFAGLDNVPQLKKDTRQALLRTADAAFANGGIEMYVSLQTAAGFPLPASLVVSLTPPHEDPAVIVAPQRLAESLRRTNREVTIVDLSAGQAVRALQPAVSGRPETLLDIHVPVPDSGSYLILSFSTPLTHLASPMAGMFDAIASTLRWIP
jgi:hypothetical protein